VVAVFFKNKDGGFEYLPDGPGAPSKIHEGDIFNTAVMGDNDRMFHRVRPVGRPEDGLLPNMTLDTRLEHLGGDDWRIADDEATRASFSYDSLRISVSWKAQVFRDRDEQTLVDEHRGDMAFQAVLDRFYGDLEARGIAFEHPGDPLRDEGFVDLLSGVYMTGPDIQE